MLLFLLNQFVYFQTFSTQDNLDSDDETFVPEIQEALAQQHCETNTCVDLPATQLLKIRVIISIII